MPSPSQHAKSDHHYRGSGCFVLSRPESRSEHCPSHDRCRYRDHRHAAGLRDPAVAGGLPSRRRRATGHDHRAARVDGRTAVFAALALSDARSTTRDGEDRHDDHDRILHALKLRAASRQFGGRDSRQVSQCGCEAHPVRRGTIRGVLRRQADLREIEARPAREARRNTSTVGGKRDTKRVKRLALLAARIPLSAPLRCA